MDENHQPRARGYWRATRARATTPPDNYEHPRTALFLAWGPAVAKGGVSRLGFPVCPATDMQRRGGCLASHRAPGGDTRSGNGSTGSARLWPRDIGTPSGAPPSPSLEVTADGLDA